MRITRRPTASTTTRRPWRRVLLTLKHQARKPAAQQPRNYYCQPGFLRFHSVPTRTYRAEQDGRPPQRIINEVKGGLSQSKKSPLSLKECRQPARSFCQRSCWGGVTNTLEDVPSTQADGGASRCVYRERLPCQRRGMSCGECCTSGLNRGSNVAGVACACTLCRRGAQFFPHCCW